MKPFGEICEKPDFWSNFDLSVSFLPQQEFSKKICLSVFSPYGPITSCKKNQKKLMSGFLGKVLTDVRTDGCMYVLADKRYRYGPFRYLGVQKSKKSNEAFSRYFRKT